MILMTSLSLIFSCGKSGDGKLGENAQASQRPSATAYPEDARGGNTCLLGYADNLDQLLTVELASEISGMPAEKSEKKYFDKMKNTAYHNVEYNWKNGRTRNMKELGMDMVLPVKDLVKLDGIKPRSMKDFKNAHKAPTDEQLSHLDAKVDEALDKKSGNEEINEKVEKLDKMNVDKSTQKSVAKTMTGAIAKITRAYSDVTGIGDAASWNSFENRLYVLDKGVELSITVDLGDDANVNKEKAINLANRLLKKCK